MINPKIAEDDIRIIDEYIRDLFSQIQDGRTAEEAVCMDYSAVFGASREEAFVFTQDILSAKKDYDLKKEAAMRELPEQYLENFITSLYLNPSYTVCQKYQILAMAKAYFLKISCISLGDALLKDELGLSFETAILAVEAEFSDRMRHAPEASVQETEALYEEVLLASEAALVLPYPLEIAQTILEYTEENILTAEEQLSLEKKRDMYLIYTYALYKAVRLGVLVPEGLPLSDDPSCLEALITYLSHEVLAMSDLTGLIQEIRGGRTTLEKVQSVIRVLVSILFGGMLAAAAAAVLTGVSVLAAEAWLSFGVLTGTAILTGLAAFCAAEQERAAELVEYLCLNVNPRVVEACQIAARRIRQFFHAPHAPASSDTEETGRLLSDTDKDTRTEYDPA
mgnify:FL=1